jgi:hypothetical protein
MKRSITSFCATCLAAWAAHAAALPSHQAPTYQIISRGEAAGSYQAFPDICRLQNGDLLCVFYAGYGHVSLPKEGFRKGGRICSVRSTDEGRTWSTPRILFDGPFDDRDPHIAQMRDGTVVCSFFTYRPQPDAKVLCDTCLVSSRDGGESWDTEPPVVAPGWPSSAPVRELPDGTRLLGVYREDGPTAYGGVIRSTDSGQTWSPPIPIGKDSGMRLDAETDFVLLKDGTLFAALRGDRVPMHFALSSDEGLTWSAPKDIGFPGHCPHFTRLSDGLILLSHRLPLTALHVSRDEGKSWQGPYQIDDTPGAYPSTVELNDGTVLAVYYEEGAQSAIRARRFSVGLSGIQLLSESQDQLTVRRSWQVGTPIVTYWAGPPMTDAVATQMADGGWNLVWSTEKDLELVRQHGLRAQLQDPLLVPTTLDSPAQQEKLDSLIERVRHHPALYSYFITDEPNAAEFPALGRLVAHLRERDPAHLAYINLFPTYASNQQLGTKGGTVTAYEEHLRQFLEVVKPDLISYDHYQFTTRGDSDQYFLNLAMIRKAAAGAGVPFLNIVQACTWTSSMRVPSGDEMRYLVYTTLAYGAQGISYYVYSHTGHTGGIALADGTPTLLYDALKLLNREFVAIARELQPLHVVGVYHSGHHPLGTQPIPRDSLFALDPPVPDLDYKPREAVKGVLLACFAPAGQNAPAQALVVNLDYGAAASVGLRGPQPLDSFDASTGVWATGDTARAEFKLRPGGGQLLRLRANP